MRYGHKQQLDKWLNSGISPDKAGKILNSLKWVTPDWWYIEEEGDGDKEKAILAKLRNTLKSERAVTTSVPVTTTTELTVNRKSLPAVKKQPSLIGKAVQLFKAVSGPTVGEEVFQSRLSKCTKEGGLTFSPVTGTVESVGPNFVQVAGNLIQLPSDESPVVKVGELIKAGQPVAESETAKPCPYLKRKTTSKGEQFWCKSCGCGDKALAELHNKLRYAKLTCPRSFPLFTPDEPTTDSRGQDEGN